MLSLRNERIVNIHIKETRQNIHLLSVYIGSYALLNLQNNSMISNIHTHILLCIYDVLIYVYNMDLINLINISSHQLASFVVKTLKPILLAILKYETRC